MTHILSVRNHNVLTAASPSRGSEELWLLQNLGRREDEDAGMRVPGARGEDEQQLWWKGLIGCIRTFYNNLLLHLDVTLALLKS